MSVLYGIFGAGGMGREVMPLVRQAIETRRLEGEKSEAVFVVDDSYITSIKIANGHRILGATEFFGDAASKKYFNVAIRDSNVRERIVNAAIDSGGVPFSITAPNFVSLDNNIIGDGSIFCNFALVTSNSRVGKFFHGNFYSYIAHDCVIGDYVTFAPGVKCNGHVIIEDHAYIGAGAIIKDATFSPIVIGRHAVVGMGAVVTKSVLPGTTVVGNPARVLIK